MLPVLKRTPDEFAAIPSTMEEAATGARRGGRLLWKWRMGERSKAFITEMIAGECLTWRPIIVVKAGGEARR